MKIINGSRKVLRFGIHCGYKYLSMIKLGRGGICPCCGQLVRYYVPYGTKRLRMDAECPHCRAAERDRVEALYLKKINIDRSAAILHFAPERWLYDYIEQLGVEEYYPVDIDDNIDMVKRKVDITYIPFDSNSFDIVICNHVLEHVENAEKGMRELARVLKPDGIAILTVPIDEKHMTLERDDINTNQLRIKYYGEANHVRMYGNDFATILKRNGLTAKKIYAADMGTDLRKAGLKENEYFWLCKANGN